MQIVYFSAHNYYLEPFRGDRAFVACGHDDGVEVFPYPVHEDSSILCELINCWHHLGSVKQGHAVSKISCMSMVFRILITESETTCFKSRLRNFTLISPLFILATVPTSNTGEWPVRSFISNGPQSDGLIRLYLSVQPRVTREQKTIILSTNHNGSFLRRTSETSKVDIKPNRSRGKM